MPPKHDVLIVEDEARQARLHADFVGRHPRLRAAGIATTIAEARRLLDNLRPRLILLDNWLPDGNGIDLLEHLVTQKFDAHVIFITAASEMEICGKAIRLGAFDYIIKPIDYDRLTAALERFCQFLDSQAAHRLVDQRRVDELYNLQAKAALEERRTKGIDQLTLARLKDYLLDDHGEGTADTIARAVGISKTTARRYLEYLVETRFVAAQISYGKVGRPERSYRLLRAAPPDAEP
ncbi:response regulator [Rubrivivax gelatinosus]|uniref:Transcriptional regulatory protein n=1 Tax=Rubrivivax gelatinosus TaxID=28068 RepID=A0ABS1DUH3_RUBGE|nr:response regulator [Rubrivivax gelatinosus]MBK1712850.1 response regulator [Rubrivivax gelatinosus]